MAEKLGKYWITTGIGKRTVSEDSAYYLGVWAILDPASGMTKLNLVRAGNVQKGTLEEAKAAARSEAINIARKLQDDETLEPEGFVGPVDGFDEYPD